MKKFKIYPITYYGDKKKWIKEQLKPIDLRIIEESRHISFDLRDLRQIPSPAGEQIKLEPWQLKQFPEFKDIEY